ncbi:unnamed protein product, partial [marine sediment metagenome]
NGETDKAALMLFGMSEDALAAEEFDRAEGFLRRIVEMDPSNEEAHRKLSEAYNSVGRPKEAIEELLKLVDLSVAARRHQAAEKHLRDIFDIDPHHKKAQEMLADLFMHAPEEERLIRESLEKAEKAMGLGRFEEARAILEEIVTLDPENGQAKSLLNALYYRQPKTRAEESEFFEDVEVEFQDQGDVDISWEGEEAPPEVEEEEPPPPEPGSLPEAAGEIDLFGGEGQAEEGEKLPSEPDAEDLDIFGEAPQGPEET